MADTLHDELVKLSPRVKRRVEHALLVVFGLSFIGGAVAMFVVMTLARRG